MTDGRQGRGSLLYAVPLLLLFLMLSSYTALVVLEGVPHSQDEVVYLFQAKILRSGNLYLQSLPDGIRQFFDHEFVVNNGKWYGKYTAGMSLLLACGLNLGNVSLVNPVIGTLGLLVMYLLALRFCSWHTAVLAAAMYAISPFSILMSASYFSHPLAQLLTLLFFYAVISGVRLPDGAKVAAWAAIAGASVGGVLLVRPYNVVPLIPYGLLFLCAVLRRARSSGRWPLRPFLAFALPCLVSVVGTLAYNRALTDEWLRFPHMAYSQWDMVGFGRRGVEWAAAFGPREALENVLRNLTALSVYQFAWPGLVPFILVPFAFAGPRRHTALLLLSLLLAQVLAYSLYFHAGTFLGPRYWYETTWVLWVLAAEGSMVLLGKARQAMGRHRANLAFVGGMAVLLSLGAIGDSVFIPAHKGYNRMTKVSLSGLEAPAIVFVPAEDRWQSYGLYFIQQSPFLESEDVIYARHGARHNVWTKRDAIPDQNLVEYFAGRNVYLLQP